MRKKAILIVYGLFSLSGILSAIFGLLILVVPITKGGFVSYAGYLLPGWAIADLIIGGLFFFLAGAYGITATNDIGGKKENNQDARYWLQKFLDENRNM